MKSLALVSVHSNPYVSNIFAEHDESSETQATVPLRKKVNNDEFVRLQCRLKGLTSADEFDHDAVS